ncbi:hypothetical protein HYPSUDRAFT_43802 [Hypholoma sublateritium FD-334 SS-4]|uniref:Iron hydrogenase large subunit C-terminal domain-containing protein n=1 Tax=Hypholoma sublateritium (strain FD-334 SS-4) TaxID=945553 RepID=A0A0D2KZL2_HYPSF|nr:hypothetical protein HYPSUDRAFT_43802 [Hypholoma sublateritium FD-334 SS-4]
MQRVHHVRRVRAHHAAVAHGGARGARGGRRAARRLRAARARALHRPAVARVARRGAQRRRRVLLLRGRRRRGDAAPSAAPRAGVRAHGARVRACVRHDVRTGARAARARRGVRRAARRGGDGGGGGRAADAGERVPWVDLLRGEGARGDAAVHRADEEPAAGDGHAREGVAGPQVGAQVRHLLSILGRLTDLRSPDGVYHVTVMPCYDKKLEASRKDFYDEAYATRDVDCVITTGELELLMREKGWDLGLAVPGERDAGAVSADIPELIQHPGTSSGSYLHAIMAHVRASSDTPLELAVKMVRNADYEEYTLTEGGRTVFKGAKCYGFRNLQNIVRKVGKERGVRTGGGAAGRLAARVRNGAKGEESKYDYVEVMACPGGCVNGGGQLKPARDAEGHERDWGDGMPSGKWGDREWTRTVEATYWRDEQTYLEARADHAGRVRGALGRRALRTGYAAVESDVVGLAVKW